MQHFIKFFFRQLRDQSDKLPPASNPRYSWAVLINNWNCSRAALKNKIDNMLIGIFGDKD